MPQDEINKLRSGARISSTEAQRMKKGLSKAQILRMRSGAQINAEEAKRLGAKVGSKAGKAAGKAAKATRRLEKRGLKRTRLGKSLTSKKRGFMSPGGSMHLGRKK